MTEEHKFEQKLNKNSKKMNRDFEQQFEKKIDLHKNQNNYKKRKKEQVIRTIKIGKGILITTINGRNSKKKHHLYIINTTIHVCFLVFI